MKIALHDNDNTDFPNLALMKLSAWHKSQGDSVEWFDPYVVDYDKVYSSKVFSWTKNEPYLPNNTEYGGTGNDFSVKLPDHIDHLCPDYDLYGVNYSVGFLTRGCIRKCDWCFVPRKEGMIRPDADIEDFAKHKNVVLLDNNVLAHEHGIKQIEKIAKLGLKIDFNQGLDARLIDDQMAKKLAAVKWYKPLRLACDHSSQMETVFNAVKLLRWHNCTPRRYFCYVLVRDIDDAIERVKFLKGLDIDVYASPERSVEKPNPTKQQKAFARWCNMRSTFKKSTWDEYKYQQPGE